MLGLVRARGLRFDAINPRPTPKTCVETLLSARATLRFFQDRNLPGMVKLVLNNSI